MNQKKMDQNPQVDTSFHLEQCDYTQPCTYRRRRRNVIMLSRLHLNQSLLLLLPFPKRAITYCTTYCPEDKNNFRNEKW